jgi:hypothetical protein
MAQGRPAANPALPAITRLFPSSSVDFGQQLRLQPSSRLTTNAGTAISHLILLDLRQIKAPAPFRVLSCAAAAGQACKANR